MKKEQFKVIVAGSRGFDNYELMKIKLDNILSAKAETHDIVIISGTARGADQLGEKYAKEKGYKIIRMPADWDKYGKRAGYIRNEEMAKIGDSAVLFWDGISPGTKHMRDLALRYKLIIRIVNY